jgi:hypothetical protein
MPEVDRAEILAANRIGEVNYRIETVEACLRLMMTTLLICGVRSQKVQDYEKLLEENEHLYQVLADLDRELRNYERKTETREAPEFILEQYPG